MVQDNVWFLSKSNQTRFYILYFSRGSFCTINNPQFSLLPTLIFIIIVLTFSDSSIPDAWDYPLFVELPCHDLPTQPDALPWPSGHVMQRTDWKCIVFGVNVMTKKTQPPEHVNHQSLFSVYSVRPLDFRWVSFSDQLDIVFLVSLPMLVIIRGYEKK